jgi:cytoskeletal protein CcmA (bactofilin family)
LHSETGRLNVGAAPADKTGKLLQAMMTNSSAPKVATARKWNGPSSGKQSVLSSDLTVEGDVLGKGLLIVQATVKGNVSGPEVFIDATATISGDVDAGALAVAGKVEGKVEADRIEIQSTGQVRGRLTYQSLAIQAAGVFEGDLRRVAPPSAPVAQPSAVAPE